MYPARKGFTERQTSPQDLRAQPFFPPPAPANSGVLVRSCCQGSGGAAGGSPITDAPVNEPRRRLPCSLLPGAAGPRDR